MQSEWKSKNWGNGGLFSSQFTNTFNILGRMLPEIEPVVESTEV